MDYANQAYSEIIQKTQLREDMGLQSLQSTLNQFWDNMLLTIASAVSDTYARNAYNILIRQAKTQSAFLAWLDEPETFLSTATSSTKKSKIPWFLVLAAAILACLALWFALPKKRDILMVCLFGAPLLLMLLQGISALIAKLVSRNSPPVHIRAEQRISVKRVQSGLQQLAHEMDAHAESLQAMLKETAILSDDVDITLVKSLLRIPASSRGDAVTDAIDLYLARNGIEKVSYSKERAELFLIIPGTHEVTVEPALVRADQVLSEGVACIKAEG